MQYLPKINNVYLEIKLILGEEKTLKMQIVDRQSFGRHRKSLQIGPHLGQCTF